MGAEDLIAEAAAEGIVFSGAHYSTGRDVWSANWQKRWPPGSMGTMPPGIMVHGGWAIFAYGEGATLAEAMLIGLRKARTEAPVSTVACFKFTPAAPPVPTEEDLFS